MSDSQDAIENTPGLASELASLANLVTETRKKAEALKPSLPSFSGEVPVPDTEMIFGWIERLCETPHRRPGCTEGHRGEEWIAEEFRRVGLEQVAVDKIPITVWRPSKWSLTVEGAGVSSFFMLNTSFTGGAGITAPLAYVGVGRHEDLAEAGVKDKIVLADTIYLPGDARRLDPLVYFRSDPDGDIPSYQTYGTLPRNMSGAFGEAYRRVSKAAQALGRGGDVYNGCVRDGAKALVMVLESVNNTLYWVYDATMKPIPGLFVGRNEGPALQEAAKRGAAATLVLDGEMSDGYMANVWGVLPGRSDEVVMVTSHHDSPHKGATEDGAGVAQVLAQAWAWSRVPREERPKTLVFLAAAGHMYGGRGSYEFAVAHPDIVDRARAIVTVEHVPSKEVRETSDGNYVETGRTQVSTMYVSDEPEVVAAVWKAVDVKPPKATLCISPPMRAPMSDAGGFVAHARQRQEAGEAGRLAYVSWICGSPYLLNDADTLDKVDRRNLVPVAETTTEIVKSFMALA